MQASTPLGLNYDEIEYGNDPFRRRDIKSCMLTSNHSVDLPPSSEKLVLRMSRALQERFVVHHNG